MASLSSASSSSTSASAHPRPTSRTADLEAFRKALDTAHCETSKGVVYIKIPNYETVPIQDFFNQLLKMNDTPYEINEIRPPLEKRYLFRQITLKAIEVQRTTGEVSAMKQHLLDSSFVHSQTYNHGSQPDSLRIDLAPMVHPPLIPLGNFFGLGGDDTLSSPAMRRDYRDKTERIVCTEFTLAAITLIVQARLTTAHGQIESRIKAEVTSLRHFPAGIIPMITSYAMPYWEMYHRLGFEGYGAQEIASATPSSAISAMP